MKKNIKIKMSEQYTCISTYHGKGINSDLLVGDFKEFLQDISCSICLDIAYNPICCKVCSSIYCKLCIDEWILKDKDKKCPMKCNFERSLLNKTAERLLNRMKVRCPNNNCTSVVAYENFTSHITKECDFALCKCNGCGLEADKRVVSMHVNMCENLDSFCPFCGVTVKRKMLDAHIKICDEKDIQCDKCFKEIKYKEWPSHEETCKNKVTCRYCNAKYYQDVQNSHPKEECIENVITLYSEKMASLKNSNDLLQTKCKAYEQQVINLTLENTHFKNLANNNNVNINRDLNGEGRKEEPAKNINKHPQTQNQNQRQGGGQNPSRPQSQSSANVNNNLFGNMPFVGNNNPNGNFNLFGSKPNTNTNTNQNANNKKDNSSCNNQ